MNAKPKLSRKRLTELLTIIDNIPVEKETEEGYSLIKYAEVTLEIIEWAEGRR